MSATRFVLMTPGLILGAVLLAGCPVAPTGDGNDNDLNENTSLTNENDADEANVNDNAGLSTNGNDSENANSSGNDNAAGNSNDAGPGNDNTSGEDNDNTSGGGNDNASGEGNDNTADNGNDNIADNGNDNDTGNGNDNSVDNTNDNASSNENDNVPPPPPPPGEETVEVGCDGLDEVMLVASPFEGSAPPTELPTEPLTIEAGVPFGVVVDVGDLGNNSSNIRLVVTLDDNLINGDTGFQVGEIEPIEAPGQYTFTSDGAADSVAGITFYAVATLISDELSVQGCDAQAGASISQVYNTQVTLTFESP